jgi:hypothetical protein
VHPRTAPDLARASATSSFTLFAGKATGTVNTSGLAPTWPMAAKSRSGSYGTLRLKNGMMVCEAYANSSV